MSPLYPKGLISVSLSLRPKTTVLGLQAMCLERAALQAALRFVTYLRSTPNPNIRNRLPRKAVQGRWGTMEYQIEARRWLTLHWDLYRPQQAARFTPSLGSLAMSSVAPPVNLWTVLQDKPFRGMWRTSFGYFAANSAAARH